MNRRPKTMEGERIGWLVGKKVRVCLQYAQIGSHSLQEQFVATYLDTVALGGAYFFVFDSEGKGRLVQTRYVLEIEAEEVAG